MNILGLTIGEWVALLGLVSAILAGLRQLIGSFQARISAPLIVAMQELKGELAATKEVWEQQDRLRKQETKELKRQVQKHEGILVEFQQRGAGKA